MAAENETGLHQLIETAPSSITSYLRQIEGCLSREVFTQEVAGKIEELTIKKLIELYVEFEKDAFGDDKNEPKAAFAAYYYISGMRDMLRAIDNPGAEVLTSTRLEVIDTAIRDWYVRIGLAL